MAGNYLGEEVVADLKGTPFEKHGPKEWALEFIERWGGTDGDDHKQWVIDQVARILNGTPVVVKKASWDRGAGVKLVEWRLDTGDPSEAYKKWVRDMKRGDAEEGEEDEYDWEEGTPP